MSISTLWAKVAYFAQDAMSSVGLARTPRSGQQVDHKAVGILADMAGDSLTGEQKKAVDFHRPPEPLDSAIDWAKDVRAKKAAASDGAPDISDSVA